MSDCINCKKYIGDCGHHFKDIYGHIDFEIPSTSYLDQYGYASCYEEKRSKYMVAYDDISNGGNTDINTILEALSIAEEVRRKKNTN